MYIIRYRYTEEVYSVHETKGQASERLRLLNAIARFRRFEIVRTREK
jgi:hypothetical protein